MIDTHAHLSFEQFSTDSEEVLHRAWQAGLEAIILIGAGGGLDSNCHALEFARQDERLFVSAGIHPCDTGNMQESWLEKLEELLSHKKIVALGEIGLDFHWPEPEHDVQYTWLRAQLPLADKYQVPIVIHSRNSHHEVWKVIQEIGTPKRGGVFHCFAGDLDFAHEVCQAGFYLGIGGVVTFKNAKELQEVVLKFHLNIFC